MLRMGKTLFSSSTEAYFNHAVIKTAGQRIWAAVDKRASADLLHATPDSEWMKSSSALWQRLSTSSGSPPEEPSSSRLDEWFLLGRDQVLRQRSSPFFPEVHNKLMKSWRAPTRLASILLLRLLSHPLTVLKKKDTSTCRLWISLWPYISARPQLSDGRRGRAICPSRAEPHLHLLDAPTLWLDKQLQRYTRWLCSKSSKPRCSPMREPVWIQPLTGTWGARQRRLYAPPKPPPKPSGVRCLAW